MKEILAALGLKEDATPEQAVAAINALKKRKTHNFDPALVTAKMQAGLTEAQAIEVLRAQQVQDEADAAAEAAAEKSAEPAKDKK
jgi:hypothetical protein